MNRGINFVYERRKRLTQSQVKDRQFFRWSLMALGAVGGVLLIVIGLRIFFVFRLKAVTDAQTVARRAIQNQESVEKEFTIFAHKLKELSTLFGKRKNKQDALIYFSELFGNVAVVSGIDYSSAEEDVLTFTIQTQNVFSLDSAFQILSQPQVTEAYPSIEKSSLRRGGDGGYRVNLTINLLGEKKPAPTPDAKAETDTTQEAPL